MKQDFKLTPDLIYLIETIKVEGYWSLENFSLCIQNKNLAFLKRIEDIIRKEIGCNITKLITVKIKPNDQNFVKEDISVFNGEKSLKFHLEKSPFDGSMKIVFTKLQKNPFKINLKIKKQLYEIVINDDEEEFFIESNIPSWAYLTLSFPTKSFLLFLKDYLGDNKIVEIQDFLFNANKNFVMSAFSALIDAEGSIAHYGFCRRLYIRMFSPDYLKQWSRLLSKFSVYAHYYLKTSGEASLTISGWQDFDLLNKLGFNIYHSKKKTKWSDIFKTYKRNQLSRNSALNYYKSIVKEMKTAKMISEETGKSLRVVHHYFKILRDKRLINFEKRNRTCYYLPYQSTLTSSVL